MIRKADRGGYSQIHLECRNGHPFGVSLSRHFILYAKEFYGDLSDAENMCKLVDPNAKLPSIDDYREILDQIDEINNVIRSSGGDIINSYRSYMSSDKPSWDTGLTLTYNMNFSVPIVNTPSDKRKYRIIVPEYT